MIAFLEHFARVIQHSFYQKQLYRDAAFAFKGRGFSILATITLLTSLAALAMMLAAFSGSKITDNLIAQMPHVIVENGVLSIDKPSPHTITFESAPETLVIDTREEANALTLEQQLERMKAEKISMLVLSKQFITNNNNKVEVRDFGDIAAERIEFGAEELSQWIGWASVFGVPIFLALFWGMMFIYAIIKLFLYTVPAIIMNATMKTNLTLEQLQRITVCAMMPITVLALLAMFMHVNIAFLVSLVVTLGYLYFGINATRSATQ